MSKLGAWIRAARLKTLPLAMAGILMGFFCALRLGSSIDLLLFIGMLMTALLLQVLSNYANDYGDFIKGTDNNARIGPQRQLQAGSIGIGEMKNAIILLAFLSLAGGIGLTYRATGGLDPIFWFFLFLGVACVYAAIAYTTGKKAYGYRALGDLAVFIFFGLVPVLGSFYLLTKSMHIEMLWPATALGLLSAGVINLNNTRDIRTDAQSGKVTVALLLGEFWARIYHFVLIIGAWTALLIWELGQGFKIPNSLYFLLLPLFLRHLSRAWQRNIRDYNPLLPELAILTLILVLTYGLTNSLNA